MGRDLQSGRPGQLAPLAQPDRVGRLRVRLPFHSVSGERAVSKEDDPGRRSAGYRKRSVVERETGPGDHHSTARELSTSFTRRKHSRPLRDV